MTDAPFSFADQIAEEDAAAERGAIEAIRPLWENRKAAAYYEAEVKKLDPSASDRGKMGALRVWLLEHDGERLYDNERGLVAYLQNGGMSDHYAAAYEVKQGDEKLYERLLHMGALVIDGKRVAELVKSGQLVAADIAPYRHQEGRTPALKVDEVKS